jgi:hypothetical protein
MVIKRGLVIGAAAEEAEEGLIVDEVGLDTELADHPDIDFYGDFSSLSALLPAFSGSPPGFVSTPYPNRSGFYYNFQNYPNKPYGVDLSLVYEPNLQLNALRGGSAYSPDHYISQLDGEWTASDPKDGSTWINLGTYANHDTRASSAAGGWQSGPVTELWIRYGICLEADIADGMTESGVKLGGMEGADWYHIAWFFPQSAQDIIDNIKRWRLATYSFGPEYAPFTNLIPDITRYLYADTWHDIEFHYKMNSADGVSDGTIQMWFDDELLLDLQDEVNFSAEGSPAAAPRELNFLHCQVFHGGTGVPSQQIHARVTGWAASQVRRIGPMKRYSSPG